MDKAENDGLAKVLEQVTLDLSAFSWEAASAAQPSSTVSYITTEDTLGTTSLELAEAARQFLFDAPEAGDDALRAEAEALLDVIQSLEPEVQARLLAEQAELGLAAKAGRVSHVDLGMIRQRIEAAREEVENAQALETVQERAIRKAVEKNQKAQEELDNALREAEEQGKIKDAEAYARYKKLREEEDAYQKQHPDWMSTEEGRTHIGDLQQQMVEAATQATDAPEVRQAVENFQQSGKEMLEASKEKNQKDAEATVEQKQVIEEQRQLHSVTEQIKEKANLLEEKTKNVENQVKTNELSAVDAEFASLLAHADVKEHGEAPAFPAAPNSKVTGRS